MADVAGLYRRFGVRLPDLGDGWVTCRCFTGRHQDRHPSARVHLRSGGFRCFTCNTGGGILDALQLLGVHDRDEARRLAVDYGILEPAPVRRPRPAPLGVRPIVAPAVANATTSDPRSRTVASRAGANATAELGGQVDYDALPTRSAAVRDRNWVYVDANGEPVGRVRRLDLAAGKKRIWQERPQGDDWVSGLNGAHLPLYRLPGVLEHARAGDRVLVVEGEKACDALERLGYFATTNAGGAGKWRDEHTASLQGATVLVVADCDMAGRLHAIRVSLNLYRAGIRVLSPFDPEPGRHDGFDIVDHLVGVADTLRAITPGLADVSVRARLRDHLWKMLAGQLAVDAAALQDRLEQTLFSADPAGHAYIECAQCGRRRAHRVTHGYAYCPCGAQREAP